MKAFAGFPAGKLSFTPLPNLFFSQLLPAIDSLAELKVTLHFFWLLHQKKGYPRYVGLRELLGDGQLLSGLKAPGQRAEDLLRQGLERAVARGTLLRVVTEGEDGQEAWYFPNTDTGRRAVAKIERGELQLGRAVLPGEAQPRADRPNIFVLYEQNIGLLSPMIAEELRDAERTYPADWIEEAFKIAVESNARNWRYIRAILERWTTEGKDEGRGRRDRERDRRRRIEKEFIDSTKR